MLKTVQQTLSCATEMLFVRLWRGPAAASAFPDTLEMEKYALVIIIQGRIQHFCQERGCTRLLLYFNTNKPHSVFFFLQNTSCIRKPQVISEGTGGWGCVPPAPFPQIRPCYTITNDSIRVILSNQSAITVDLHFMCDGLFFHLSDHTRLSAYSSFRRFISRSLSAYFISLWMCVF